MTSKMKLAPCLAGFLVVFANSAAAQEPHVHGVASLQVAVDGDTLQLNLTSPLDNLVGFEHALRTDKEKAAVRALAARLKKADVLFVPTAAARCALTGVKLESPVIDGALLNGGGSPPETHAHDDEHAELFAEFVFRCDGKSLHGLEVKLFDVFRELRRIDAQVVSQRGQAAAKLTPAKRRVQW